MAEKHEIDIEDFANAVDLLVSVSVHSETCMYFETRAKYCCRCVEDTVTDALKLLGVKDVAALKRAVVDNYEKHQKSA